MKFEIKKDKDKDNGEMIIKLNTWRKEKTISCNDYLKNIIREILIDFLNMKSFINKYYLKYHNNESNIIITDNMILKFINQNMIMTYSDFNHKKFSDLYKNPDRNKLIEISNMFISVIKQVDNFLYKQLEMDISISKYINLKTKDEQIKLEVKKNNGEIYINIKDGDKEKTIIGVNGLKTIIRNILIFIYSKSYENISYKNNLYEISFNKNNENEHNMKLSENKIIEFINLTTINISEYEYFYEIFSDLYKNADRDDLTEISNMFISVIKQVDNLLYNHQLELNTLPISHEIKLKSKEYGE